MERRAIRSCNEVEPGGSTSWHVPSEIKFLVKLFVKSLWVSEARAKPLPSESKFQKYFWYNLLHQ